MKINAMYTSFKGLNILFSYTIFIHPFLLAFYPALFLYSQNINLYRENVLVTPLAISFITSILIFLLCLLIIRRLGASAIISSFLIAIFFSYSRIKEPFKYIQFDIWEIPIGSDKILFITILVVFISLIALIIKNKKHIMGINKSLSIFSLILVTITFFNVSSQEIKRGRVFLSGFIGEQGDSPGPFPSKSMPDIYYFILDRYGGEKTLKDYGFDNSLFLNFLKSKGFYIATDSTSNYPKTFLSISSTLNMEYLGYLTQKTNGGGTSDESVVTPLVQNNKVIQLLKNKGYLYIHVGSGWDPTRSNPYADQNFVMNNGRYPFTDEFTSGFLQTTIASTLLKKLFPDNMAVSKDPKNNDQRSRILYEFDILNQVEEIPGPKFVFTHILIPHEPYVLDKDCQPLTEKTVLSRGNIENYLNQLQCANKKMEIALKGILGSSRQTPIIIIQADEGPLPMKNPIPSSLAWKNASDASLKEKFPILNAYLLPDLKENILYPSITPVNSFRLIFNYYFNSKLPLLPDKNYVFEDDKNYYKFIEVTEKLINRVVYIR